MLKLREDQLTLWDAILPEPFRSLPEELAKIDALLDDPAFMKPYIEKHPSQRGRPTIPAETYLRLMVLKFRYNLGYETLVKEVGDSITWGRFCRIAIDANMPDASTLIKARKRYGDDMIEQLNEALLLKLQEKELLKTRKIRIDTTVVESDVHHPTDATLLQDGVNVITRLVNRIRKVASQAVQGFQDSTLMSKRNFVHRQAASPSNSVNLERNQYHYRESDPHLGERLRSSPGSGEKHKRKKQGGRSSTQDEAV